jgi:hypothetical protein
VCAGGGARASSSAHCVASQRFASLTLGEHRDAQAAVDGHVFGELHHGVGRERIDVSDW